VNPGLPTNGDGSYEWKGWLAPNGHVHAIDPPGGQIVNWNNKPGASFAAADDNWSYGSVHRVQLLNEWLPTHRATPAEVVSAMNHAATKDLRAELVPLLAKVMARTAAPNARDSQILALLAGAGLGIKTWDGSRLDANLDGKIDDPAAAIMDAWWPRLAVAVLQPVLGPLTDQLKTLAPISDDANPGGSSYDAGWYGYVNTDLLGKPGFSTKYCGNGDLNACSVSLWQSLDAAGNALAAAQGPDPTAWRADATGERIRFAGFIPNTMRWTNRPTFQQVVVFGSHR
jgi:acyl-homoserine lactone acylase PvdQ